MSGKNAFRLYNDLSWLWPIWGDPVESRQWAKRTVRLMEHYARRELKSLLHMGCGGGKDTAYLKRRFRITGIDRSPVMLKQAQEHNPDCIFLKADIRTARLGRRFDAVYLDDAVMYMTTETDLRTAFETAYRHLRPGGVMVTGTDVTKDRFSEKNARISYSNPLLAPKGVEAVFIEINYDPDPEDDTFDALIVYVIRERNRVRVEKDWHRMGIFSLATWRTSLCETGFEVHERKFKGADMPTFACIRPGKGLRPSRAGA